jgi:cbb3-type cytochrome oxidase cytochrome c subunit
VKGLTQKVDDLDKRIAAMRQQATTLERKIESITPTLTTLIRDAPIIDMASPTLKVDQVILPHLLTDINFMTIQKVDRCVTCHKGIMDSDYENEAQPFTAHPRLDLYLTDSSPHPYNKIGCTICHQGLDRATSFASAMHTPRDEHQEHEWEERYGWEEAHYWDSPQLPAQHAQASCRLCHTAQTRVEGAERYNRGLDILERAGCYGCHRIEGYQDRRKAGPDLQHVASKIEPEWAYRWIENPRDYRPNTWMPRFFHLTNTSAPDDVARSQVEIDSIVSFLFARSTPFEPLRDRVSAGDVARGKALVMERGCLGCHRIEESPTMRGTFGRDFGPALDRVGDKMTAAWVYDWIRNPKRYFAETNMPVLRLTDREAADVTAYLMSLRKGEPAPPPPLNEELLTEVTVEYLKARLTDAQARERAVSMSVEERKVFLGEKLIGHYGCYGCHNIPGFENALPIGPELTSEGTKMITRLDFGFVHIPHTKPAWFYQKMKDPRIFDTGKVKAPREKLKMPDFGFTDDEADTMVTLIMSMQKDVQPPESHYVMTEQRAAIEAGRRLIQDKNCRGCHVIEGDGGAIQEVIADQAFYPPNLFGEGEKVQSDWLFRFLKDPAPIRPWLNVKMPTFRFDDGSATEITRYFAVRDEAAFPFQTTDDTPPPRELLTEGRKTFEQFKCLSCHPVGDPPPGVALADLAPNLGMASERLRHDWITKWLTDPQEQMPGTRMPGFFYSDGTPLYPDADRRMEAVKEYLLTLEPDGGRASRGDGRPGSSPSAQ